MRAKLDSGHSRELEHEMSRHLAEVRRMVDAARTEEPATTASDSGMSFSRRGVLRGASVVATSGIVAGTLGAFMSRRAHAHRGGFNPTTVQVPCPYGAPVPTKDEVTGLPLIGLPPGFKYYSHGWTGDPIYPGLSKPATPALHDGMGVLEEHGPLAVLCRNHEAGVGPSFFSGGMQYSPGAAGGNTNMLFDRRRAKWLSVFPTLSGTVRNCGGGTTPQGTWLSCEETGVTTSNPADPTQTFTHGWVFDVPALNPSNAKPIKAMGRRSHEAGAVDPHTGYVYLTEDGDPGGVYRFIPNDRTDYQQGGRLEILRVSGLPNANLRGTVPQGSGPGAPYPAPVGESLDIEWVPIHDPENLVAGNTNFSQGAAQGAAIFRRPEGAWYGDGHIYFVCTDGGQSGNGQVFSINTRKNDLTLIYDAPTADELDNPDNLVVTPRGGLLFCEDNSGNPTHMLDGVSTERLVALTREGEIFTFANNLVDFSGSLPTSMPAYTRPNNPVSFNQNWRAQEWAGATFDKRGEWLFVNIQTPGITFAITGPWHKGPL